MKKKAWFVTLFVVMLSFSLLTVDVKALKHEVIISSVTPSANQVMQGGTVYIDVVVNNTGDYREIGLDVRAYWNITPIDVIGPIELDAGAWQTVTVTWDTGDPIMQCSNYKIKADVRQTITPINITTYSKEDGYVFVGAHDVAVKKVSGTPTGVTAGQHVTVEVIVENQGNFTETFDVTAYYDGTSIGTETVTDLAPKPATQTLTFDWDTSAVVDGSYMLNATATTVSLELDTDDNTREGGEVNIPGLHDIGIISCYADQTTAKVGDTVTITVLVQNQGDFAETFDVTVYYDSTPAVTQSVTVANRTDTGKPFVGKTVTLYWYIDPSVPTGTTHTLKAEVPSDDDPSDDVYVDGDIVFSEMAVEPRNNLASVGTTFTIDLTASEVEDLFVWGVRLTWNATLLTTTTSDIVEGPFLSSTGGTTWFIRMLYVTEGYVDLGGVIYDTAGMTGPVTGSGVLCSITFEVLAEGGCDLDLLDASMESSVELIYPTPRPGKFQTPLRTDINADGVINIFDLAFVAIHYGTSYGEPGYNPLADINDDTVINIVDLAMVAKDYGKYL